MCAVREIGPKVVECSDQVGDSYLPREKSVGHGTVDYSPSVATLMFASNVEAITQRYHASGLTDPVQETKGRPLFNGQGKVINKTQQL